MYQLRAMRALEPQPSLSLFLAEGLSAARSRQPVESTEGLIGLLVLGSTGVILTPSLFWKLDNDRWGQIAHRLPKGPITTLSMNKSI